jgi:hypothetical protein
VIISHSLKSYNSAIKYLDCCFLTRWQLCLGFCNWTSVITVLVCYITWVHFVAILKFCENISISVMFWRSVLNLQKKNHQVFHKSEWKCCGYFCRVAAGVQRWCNVKIMCFWIDQVICRREKGHEGWHKVEMPINCPHKWKYQKGENVNLISSMFDSQIDSTLVELEHRCW